MAEAKKKNKIVQVVILVLVLVGVGFIAAGFVNSKMSGTSQGTVSAPAAQQSKSETYAEKMKREDEERKAWLEKKNAELKKANAAQEGN